MWRRLVDVFRRRRLDADLDAQWAFHLDALEAESVRGGCPPRRLVLPLVEPWADSARFRMRIAFN